MVAALEWLRHHAAKRGTAHAVVDGTLRVSYADLETAAKTVADAVCAHGVSNGDRVGLIAENSVSFVAAYLGIVASGAAVVPLGPGTPSASRDDIVTDTGMRLVVVDDTHHVAGMNSHSAPRVIDLWPNSGAPPLTFLPLPPDATGSDPAPDHDTPAGLQAIIYTSGTTGRPKGVMLTQSALRHVAESAGRMLGLTAGDRIGIITPLFHLYALREIDAALRVGACLILARTLTFPASVLRQLHQERVTYLSGVPAGFALFVERYAELLGACRDHLRAITLGTAPTPPALAATLRALLPGTRVILTYGLTEASRVCYREGGTDDHKIGSIGRPYPGVELVTVDDEGRTLPAGTRGRVAIRTAMAAAGYWNRPAATRALHLANGWILSPDYGVIDADGYLFLHGRADDVINSGGEKISPDEVESVLRQHPDVADCVALSAPDPNGRLGEIVAAVVVPALGASIDADMLTRFCADRLELYKVPRVIRFANDLPRTVLGKVDRGRLRATQA